MEPELSGAEKERLSAALLDAFRSVNELQRMVLYKCCQRLAELTSGSRTRGSFAPWAQAPAFGQDALIVIVPPLRKRLGWT